MAFIYVITNNINGKQYIGKTNDSIEKRFKRHVVDSRKQPCKNRPLYAAINKYGAENFSVKLLEECPFELAEEREQFYIEQFNTYYNGYNATLGGDGKTLYNYKELSNAYLELGTVKAVAEKYGCDIQTVRRACHEYNIPIKTGQEHQKEDVSKAVFMLDKETEEIIKSFPSCSDAAKIFTGSRAGMSHISDVCKGRRKTAYGYKWKYVNDIT